MLDYQLVDSIHIELTDKCNASCPQCARNQSGGKVNEHLPLVELSLEDIKSIIPFELITRLKKVLFCGNYGDPIIAKDLLDILTYLKSINPKITLHLNTNGSARDTDWWAKVGNTLGKNGEVRFGIDGLQDTHALYRKGTDFDKIIKNAKAFIDGGGRAIWEYIVFKHNEHQIEEARLLAHDLGFEKFVLKKTGRFFSNSKLEKKDFQEVLDSTNTPIYKIELPTNKDFHNKSLLMESEIVKTFDSLQDYLDQTEVACKVIKERSFYISSEGLVFPCCWTAGQMYLWYLPSGESQIQKLLELHGGPDEINAKKNSLINIFNSSFFHAIKKSWSCEGFKQGKLQVCSKTCGSLFDQFKDQYK